MLHESESMESYNHSLEQTDDAELQTLIDMKHRHLAEWISLIESDGDRELFQSSIDHDQEQLDAALLEQQRRTGEQPDLPLAA